MGDRTRLEYSLLALLARAPRTGSGLCRRLAELPLGGRGTSSGAVYPALKRLEAAGLVETSAKPRRADIAWYRYGDRYGSAWYMDRRPIHVGRCRLYHLTRQGWLVVRGWALEAIARRDMLACPETLLLKFMVLATVDRVPVLREPADASQPASFLSEYARVAEGIGVDLRARTRDRPWRFRIGSRDPTGRGPPAYEERLAAELLARLFETRSAWARRAARGFARASPPGRSTLDLDG